MQSLAQSNPAYHRLRADYIDYHVAFVVVGGLFAFLVVLFCVVCWIRFKRSAGPRPWSFEKKTYFAFGLLSLAVGLVLALWVMVNLSTVLDPNPGFSGAIGSLGTAPVRRHASELTRAFGAWMQSGSAHIPPLIQQKIDERLAWQRPKAVITGVLLVVFVLVSAFVWRSLIARSKSSGTRRRNASTRSMLALGSLSVLACLVLLPMVIRNTQASFAPITLTLLFG